MPLLTATLLLGLLGAPIPQEPVRSFDLLDNGDFTEAPPRQRDERGTQRIPWWRASGGTLQLEERAGRPCLRTADGEYAEQPVPLYAPLASGLLIRGAVGGRGRLSIRDGGGGEVQLAVGDGEADFVPFECSGAQLAEALGRAPLPRLTLRLAAGESSTAHWRDLEVLVPLPCPEPEALRAEVVEELRWILELWRTHAGDSEGEPTTFLAHTFDVLTGEALRPMPGGHNTYTDLLVAAAAAAPQVPEWRERAELATRDVLERAVHPVTGLPRTWDCALDRPRDEAFAEVGQHLGFLLEVAEGGPPPLRERALELARRGADTILARGVSPDGEVSAKYRPRDGTPNPGFGALRRLDVPAQLVRLARLAGDEGAPYLDAAREAVGCFEYTHRWAGNWREIDPAFDDEYGHYGARAVAMWADAPGEETFRRLALGGFEHFAPLWRDALRLGGNVAADQVRCWEILLAVAEEEPALAPRIASLISAALRSHVKGQQYDGGAWGDVTVFHFDPQADLQVGDTFGPPQNLLVGLAVAYDPLLTEAAGGPDREKVRALFTAVLRSTREVYRRPHGYLSSRREMVGINECAGSMRVAVGLVKMLERL